MHGQWARQIISPFDQIVLMSIQQSISKHLLNAHFNNHFERNSILAEVLSKPASLTFFDQLIFLWPICMELYC